MSFYQRGKSTSFSYDQGICIIYFVRQQDGKVNGKQEKKKKGVGQTKNTKNSSSNLFLCNKLLIFICVQISAQNSFFLRLRHLHYFRCAIVRENDKQEKKNKGVGQTKNSSSNLFLCNKLLILICVQICLSTSFSYDQGICIIYFVRQQDVKVKTSRKRKRRGWGKQKIQRIQVLAFFCVINC